MEDEFITIKWGNTIHNDNTIMKRTIYKFDTINGLRSAWDNRNRLSDCEYEANTDELTITAREWANADEYFATLEEEE